MCKISKYEKQLFKWCVIVILWAVVTGLVEPWLNKQPSTICLFAWVMSWVFMIYFTIKAAISTYKELNK